MNDQAQKPADQEVVDQNKAAAESAPVDNGTANDNTTEQKATGLAHLREEFAAWFEEEEREAAEVLAWIESKL